MKNIIFIAPLPPPLTGQSLASQVLYEGIKDKYNIETINYSRKDALNKSKLSLSGVIFIVKMVLKIFKFRKKVDMAYFTITQSRFGNLKDILFLFLLGGKLRKRTVVHLHGGYFDKLYDKSWNIIKFLNKALFQNIAFGVVLGDSLRKCLTPVINEGNIKVVNNFYEDYLKISQEKFIEKWRAQSIVRALYLSNIMTEKGFGELIAGYKELDYGIKEKVVLDFAGDFESEYIKNNFFENIKSEKNISYLGTVKSEDKKKLFHSSHILILPTYYHIEGQPISILEAYASGLYVITTDQGGICDIFKDGINGKLIEKKSISSIKNALSYCINNPEELITVAQKNLIYSDGFRREKYISEIDKLFEEI